MAVPNYGADIADVNQLLVWDVNQSDAPTARAIKGWLELGSAELHAKIGDLQGTCDDEGFTERAKHIVILFAAAMAEDAHYPERALDREAGGYGAVLWKRWRELTDALVGAVEDCRDGTEGGQRGGAAHSFPEPPFFTRTMGF